MRVGLLGGECTGKTTLAGSLADALGAARTTEALRDFVDARGRTPRADEQHAILLDQRAREDALRDRIVVGDPATLMTAVYSAIYFDDDSLDDLAIAQARDYDVLLWCRPDIPWVEEPGQHDGPAMRQRADDRIGELIARHDIPVVVVKGTPQARLDIALEAIRQSEDPAWQPGGGVGGT